MRGLFTTLTAGLILAGGAHAQTITAVLDAAAYTSGVAQGSVFVVKGANLSASGFVQASALPLGSTMNNVKITFTPVGGGTSIDAYMVYTYNLSGVNQLAAVLPSSVRLGDHNVTVTNGSSTGAAFRTTVVARKLGIITQDGSGSGNAVVQNFISTSQYDVNRLTTGTFAGSTITYSPTKPGQVIVIWGTGFGAITTPDNNVPGAIDFRNQAVVRVIVGGQTLIPDIYAGRAPGLPGTDEIILTMPASVPTGCTVSLQVTVDGQFSNAATIAIAPNGSDACQSSTLTKDVLQRLDQGGSITTGSFLLGSFTAKVNQPPLGTITVKNENASGSFVKFSGAQLASALQLQNPSGTCQVFHRLGTTNAILFGGGGTTLDAGQSITLAGPNVLATNNVLKKNSDNLYNLDLGIALSGITLPIPIPGFNAAPILTSGTYTLTGTGGSQIGAFRASVTLGTPIVVSPDPPATVNRSQGVTLSWTGGAATDIVQVIGISGTTAGGTADNPQYDAGAFVCTGAANLGKIVVPASVTSQLPVTPANFLTAGTGIGYLFVVSSSTPTASSGLFSAPIVGGGNIDLGVLLGAQGAVSQAAFQ